MEKIRKQVLIAMIIFVVLPPTPVIIAVILVSYFLGSYTILFSTLTILIPIIAFFTTLKIWLWKSTYLDPLKSLGKHIRNLKSMGYRIDDSAYVVFPSNVAAINVRSYEDIPKSRMYRVAALETGRKWCIVLIGIANEYNQVYDLTKIKP